jgi:hypothetical protein
MRSMSGEDGLGGALISGLAAAASTMVLVSVCGGFALSEAASILEKKYSSNTYIW